jgi:hypothetical protein
MEKKDVVLDRYLTESPDPDFVSFVHYKSSFVADGQSGLVQHEQSSCHWHADNL